MVISIDFCIKKTKRMILPYRRLPLVIIIISFFVICVFYSKLSSIYQLQEKCLNALQSLPKESSNKHVVPKSCPQTSLKRKYFLSAKNSDGDYLQHVRNVFAYLGYVRAENVMDSWDVMWAYEYPFSSVISPDSLRSHQLVNHFPGLGFLTSKVFLATSKFKYIPQAFSLPRDKNTFLTFANKHKDKLWVQKSNKHRGITIKAIDQLDLTASETFVQEFVQNPFLVDGRKFDIGIYTIITSIDPLRVYVMETEWLIRYCSKDYNPFDANDPNKYVVGDDYTPTWKMPSLNDVYDRLQFSHKKSLFYYMKKQGHDPSKMKKELYNAIAEIVYEKKPDILRFVSKYPSGSKSFFEMVRFDFVIDSSLNVYLMEVNMSPNLSSGHFKPNSVMYEQVIFSTLNLVGLSRVSDHRSAIDEIFANDKNLQVYGDECLKCSGCNSDLCKLCLFCLTNSVKEMLKTAFRERLNQGHCVRVYPQPTHIQKNYNNYAHLSYNDRLLHMWYKGKCIDDKAWCD